MTLYLILAKSCLLFSAKISTFACAYVARNVCVCPLQQKNHIVRIIQCGLEVVQIRETVRYISRCKHNITIDIIHLITFYL